MSHLPPRREAPASAGLARRLYEDGLPLSEIRRRTGLSGPAVYYWIDREVAADGTVTVKPVPRRRPVLPAAKPAPPSERAAKRRGPPAGRKAPKASASPRRRLLARLWRAAERQVADIEQRLDEAGTADEGEGAMPRRSADTEKDVRALALLARTLRELSAAEEQAEPSRDRKAGAPHDDSVRDFDTFRRELARRLDRLRAEGDGGEAAG